MDRAEVAVCTLLAIISSLLVYFLLKDRKEKKEEIFADRIKTLISLLKKESYKEWGHIVSYRFWSLRINDFLLKVMLFRYNTYEDYVGACVLFEKEWKGCKKLDFQGEESVEKFLQGLLEEVRKYYKQRVKAIREFTRVEGFSAPYDVFVKMQGDKCIFLYFDHLNYCTCAEVEVDAYEVKWAIERSKQERLETSFGSSEMLTIFENQAVKMRILTPAGWLPATFNKEDFEKALKEAQKS